MEFWAKTLKLRSFVLSTIYELVVFMFNYGILS